ncbi:MAG: hypothetical protein KGO96_11900 [Elusimicrobia bacterium]|nr:hypothetical protein [Elusimicrobiota bacterium]MDE2237619.1 hypothetical protein [Elusimicrobiota bacterium]MDE2426598.1 hypothetical protein [Elusimicrobiota bacterium]
MSTPLFDPMQIHFLRPRPALQELSALLEIRSLGVLGIDPQRTPGADGWRGDLGAAFLDTLVESGWLERLECGVYRHEYRLNAAGQQRLRYLLVDYFQELLRLSGMARQLLRLKLVELYAQGARRVAFYPASETAEVAHSALEGTGLSLGMVVDDDDSKWGSKFHDMEIEPPSALSPERVDTVLITTCAFEKAVLARLEPAKAKGLRVAVFL